MSTLTRLFRHFSRPQRTNAADHTRFYRDISLSPSEIATGGYKQFLGGGDRFWDSRGAFQLHFLKQMGLQPAHVLLDVGCGPLRAGVHCIPFLLPGRYHGCDYNQDFITVAKQTVRDKGLAVYEPRLTVVDDFDFPLPDEAIDFVMVFSVLNHCNIGQRSLFFRSIGRVAKRNARIYISHALWFDDADLRGTRLAVTRRFPNGDALGSGIDISAWGWVDDSPFPILELSRRDAA